VTPWNQYPVSQNPPSGFVEKDFVKLTVGKGLYQEPLIILYWVPRPGEERFRKNAETEITKAREAYVEATAPAGKVYNEAMASALKAYNEATVPARKAHDEAVAAAREAYYEVMAPAQNAYNEAESAAQETLEFATMQYAFEPPSTKYVVYREDEDRWAETEDPDEARNLVRSALAEIREERESLKEKVTRTREWAAKGVKVARFDPSKVFFRRRPPVRVRGHRRRH